MLFPAYLLASTEEIQTRKQEWCVVRSSKLLIKFLAAGVLFSHALHRIEVYFGRSTDLLYWLRRNTCGIKSLPSVMYCRTCNYLSFCSPNTAISPLLCVFVYLFGRQLSNETTFGLNIWRNVHLDHICVKFEGQGHRSKFQVTRKIHVKTFSALHARYEATESHGRLRTDVLH